MALLTQEQKDAFWRGGMLVVGNAVGTEQLVALRAEFAALVGESRARFDVQQGGSDAG